MIKYRQGYLLVSLRKEQNVKKILCYLCVLLISAFSAAAAPVYKYEKTTPVTDTVTLTQVEEFHFDHNMSYSYISADLSDEHISLELLKSDKGIDVLDNLSSIAESDKRTVAAVNGDFFSAYKNGYGFSLGIEVKDRKLLQSPIYPDTMASTMYDGKSVVFDYIDFEITISDAEGNTANVRHLNKHTDYYGDILMFTHEFGAGYSPAVGGDVVEVVVVDGKISDIRRNSERVEIPENGCVFAVSEGVSMFFSNNFEIGDEIFIEYKSSANLDNIITAFGGGSMLVYEGKDVGKIGDYKHTVAGLHPRTALGVNEDGTKLILLTVDGRQEMSRGMRMSHLAELLIELGCYNAVNLDGGGSTRMLSSDVWSEGLTVSNNPTENRKVINAIGIVFDKDGINYNDTAKENEPEEDKEELKDSITDEKTEDDEPLPFGILIKSDKDKILRGDTATLELAVFDKHKRRIEYDKEKIEWSATKGEIKDGIFYGDCKGKVTVSVTLGDLYADTEIYVVDSIDGIVTDSRLIMNVGDEYIPKIDVFDYNGIYMTASEMSMFEISSSDEDVVSIKDGVLCAKTGGTAIVTIKKDNAESRISVAVGTKAKEYNYGFEENDFTFDVYPEDVKGGFELSSDVFAQGKWGGKFTFDFTVEIPEQVDLTQEDEQIISIAETQLPDDVSKAVYCVFDKQVPLDNSCDNVNIMFYSENEFKHKLRLEVEGADGKTKLIDFKGDIPAGEWTNLTATVPDKVKRPAYVKRVYVLYSPGEEQDMGEVYVDELHFLTFEPFATGETKANVYRNNLCNANVDYTFRVAAETTDDVITPTLVFENQSIKNMVKRAENFFVLADDNDYGVFEDDRAFYVSLDTSRGGIRNTDKNQWKNIVNIASKTDKENLFLLCNNEIFSEDEFENRVIVDYLSSIDKNVFVISRSDNASYRNIGGVKYFTLDKTPKSDILAGKSRENNCIEFRFGESVTFDFVSI